MSATATFKKGHIVSIAPEMRWDGKVKTGETVCNRIWRDRTEEDHAAWSASDDSKGMTSGGDTKLDSPSRWRTPEADEVFKIVRSRVAARQGWGNPISGCAEIVDADGVHWFVKRSHLH